MLRPALHVIAAVLALAPALAHAQPAEDEPPLPSGRDGESDEEEEPALPAGLGDDDEPALPSGLGDDDGDEPALPSGLGGDDDVVEETPPPPPMRLPLEWRVSADLRGGTRVVADPFERTLSIAELRVQLDVTQSFRPWSTSLRLVVDAVGDPLADSQKPDLETGQGAVDLRTASVTLTPSERLDVRLGRQILTWGTGDLLFINDLFPKDWTAFLIGRDVDYLKAPSDAVKLALFTPVVGVDLVLTPRLDADRLPVRDRLSSWDPGMERIAGEDAPLVLDQPDEWLGDGELAARVHRNWRSWELAGYGYLGFWKSPAGADPMTGAATFPGLAVYGASARGPIGRGITSIELGYYDSLDDRGGDDPLVRNSEARGLIGYERQLARNLTTSAQYYVEWMRDHAGYRAGLPAGSPAADELRHLVTGRLTWLSARQRLRLSLFAFVSPSDRDGYVRPSASYAIDDHWSASAGANLLAGTRDHTFFGQLEHNSNVYVALRYVR